MEAPVIVSSLNRMIDDASAGKRIFYDLSTDTGLFCFRGKPGAPFAVIVPGGGFAYVGSVHEGFPYAVEINKRGYNAFVLKYRTGRGGAVATQDLAAALSHIFRCYANSVRTSNTESTAGSVVASVSEQGSTAEAWIGETVRFWQRQIKRSNAATWRSNHAGNRSDTRYDHSHGRPRRADGSSLAAPPTAVLTGASSRADADRALALRSATPYR